HVEAGVNYHWTSRLLSKGFNDFPVEWVCLMPHGLYSRGIVDVRDCRNRRTLDVEFINSPQGLFFRSHFSTLLLSNVGHQQHVGTVGIQVEPLANSLSQDARRKWTKAFAVLDLQIHRRLHFR